MAPVNSVVSIPNQSDLGLYYECLAELAVTGEDWRRAHDALNVTMAAKSGFSLAGQIFEENVVYEAKQDEPIRALAVSSDGNFLATGSSKGIIRVVPLGNLISGRLEEPAIAIMPTPIYSLAFTPGGKIMAGTADNKLAFVPLDQILAEEKTLSVSAVTQAGKVFSIAQSADHKALLQAGQGFLSLIKMGQGTDGPLPSKGSIVSIEGTFYASKFLGPSDFFVAAYENGQLFYGHADSPKMYIKDLNGYRAAGGCYGMDYHPETGRLAVVGPGYLEILNISLSKDIPVISSLETYQSSDINYSASFSKRGDKLAVGVDAGGVDVFKLDGRGKISKLAEYRPYGGSSNWEGGRSGDFDPALPALPPFSPTNQVKFCVHDTAIAAVTEQGDTRIIGDRALLEGIGDAVLGPL